tara:strand:- start:42477 stop:44606 length:2130 start_codon:yes stop_codon:yes gene_type:complete
MSYIINNTNPFVSIKLTEIGREQLSQGQLTFSYWGIGDSEINYGREAIVDANQTVAALSGSSKILRPFDQQPNIKSYITGTNLNPYQVLNESNKSVIKAIVNNQATERGFFDSYGGVYTTLIDNKFTPYTQSISNLKLTGGTQINLSATTAFTVGDIILLKVGNVATSAVTVTGNSKPIPNLWYKIQALTSTNVTLDRKTPNYSAQTAVSQIIVYRGGEITETIATGTTTAYWDTGTLSFNANDNITCHDVPVWNMNNIWSENPAGITGATYENFTKYGSYQYLGFKNPYSEYLPTIDVETTSNNCNSVGSSYSDTVNKAISIIHFTNNSISNLYGEFLYIDNSNGKTTEVYMPDFMYHRRNYSTGSGTTQGMRFIASGVTNVVGNSNVEYVNLIEDVSMISSALTPITVGRVYPQLKIIVFDNDEIVAALSYKSNRNWTLPELAATLSAPSGGTSTGALNVNETMYLTYSLENSGMTSGLTSSLSCQTYIKITNDTSGPKDVSFRLVGTDLLPYMRKIESSGYDGLGFHANKFKLVYQIVGDAEIRPDSGAWKTYDFTSTAITGVSGQTINPKLLENQTPFVNGFVLDSIKNASAGIFNIGAILNLPLNTQPQNLQFGDERFFYGNVKSYIGATIYKTIFDLNIFSGNFPLTTNPTRSNNSLTNPANIRITEVGIYDTNKNLVCIGKLSTPVALIPGATIMLEVSIDF